MSKIKTNKEYTIKIEHPTLGIYYYSYCGFNDKFRPFVFTKNLSKVQTWKTTKFVEKHIESILSKINQKSGKIYLSLGTEPDENLSRELKENSIISRKMNYYIIEKTDNIRSKIGLITAEENIKELDVTLIQDSDMIANEYINIKNNFYINKINKISNDNINVSEIITNIDNTLLSMNSFDCIQKKFYDKVNKYNKDIFCYKESCKIIKEEKNYNGLYLEIYDASNKFRKLKIQTLRQLQSNE